jgi:predicted flap endonuclease-1-like 5' DNA nuclease
VKTSRPDRLDDLTRVHGIDIAAQEYLNEKGIYTFAQLAGMRGEALQILLDEDDQRFNGLKPANWPAQARYLAAL